MNSFPTSSSRVDGWRRLQDKTTQPDFDYEAWKAKHMAYSNEAVPRWNAAVKAKYGKDGQTRFACVGYCTSALPLPHVSTREESAADDDDMVDDKVTAPLTSATAWLKTGSAPPAHSPTRHS